MRHSDLQRQHISAFLSRPRYHFAKPTKASHEQLSDLLLPNKMVRGKQPIAITVTKLCREALQSVNCCNQMRSLYLVEEGQQLKEEESLSPSIIVKEWHWPIGTYVL